jgi:hypothetical protein
MDQPLLLENQTSFEWERARVKIVHTSRSCSYKNVVIEEGTKGLPTKPPYSNQSGNPK